MMHSLLKPFLLKLNPEFAHNLVLWALKHNLVCHSRSVQYISLQSKIWGVNFINPIGMAAGFDKNADVFANLFNFGFGFVEAGTVTPELQIGNDFPRIFRLIEDEAIINRLGFNNLGVENFLCNVQKNSKAGQVLGINVGKNRDTSNAIDDYILLLKKVYGQSEYITVNISSPNTKNLRNLQKADELDLFLKEILCVKKQLQQEQQKNIPILLKIAPDLTQVEQEAIADISLRQNVDGLVVANATVFRPQSLQGRYRNEIGGLSGRPLFGISNLVLQNMYKLTKGKIPIVAGGGVSSGVDAYHKIKLGASLVQIYSAFVYQGLGLVEQIKKDLNRLLKNDGFKNIKEAVGVDL